MSLSSSGDSAASRFLDRHYRRFALAVLALALFNLTFRLGQEFVLEWDESLYAINAWEALTQGSWIGTTFFGQLDYYNSKPPLLVWGIALMFKGFGVSLTSLRLVSATAAWLTVVALQIWLKRAFGSVTALAGSLILATMFGSVYVHSGRSAATDAPFTLVVTLTAIVAWAERERPWQRLWLGPLVAAAFLLRGMAALLPLGMFLLIRVLRRGRGPAWPVTLGAIGLCLAPIAAWMIARYRVDGWAFFQPLFMYDFVARAVRPIEEHPGRYYYYLKVFQGHHYDWLLATVTVWLLMPARWGFLRQAWLSLRSADSRAVVLWSWGVLTLVIPTLMQTKVPWYLNTFYPVFASVAGLIMASALSVLADGRLRRRMLAAVIVTGVAVSVAESKLLWYSYQRRDLRFSGQSLLLAERERLRGQRIFLESDERAWHFVAEAIVGAIPVHVGNPEEGEYVLSTRPCGTDRMELLRSTATGFLCQHRTRDDKLHPAGLRRDQ